MAKDTEAIHLFTLWANFASLTSLITIVIIDFLEDQNMVGLYVLGISEIFGTLPLNSDHIRFILSLLHLRLYGKIVISFLGSTTIAILLLTRSLSIVMIQLLVSFLTISYELGMSMLISKAFYLLLGKVGSVRARYVVSSVYALSITLLISLQFYIESLSKWVTTWFFTHVIDNNLLLSAIFSFQLLFKCQRWIVNCPIRALLYRIYLAGFSQLDKHIQGISEIINVFKSR